MMRAPLRPKASISVSNTLSTAELFDPKSRAWTAAAELLQARSLHTSTVLKQADHFFLPRLQHP
jgi:hypothetical protein